MDIIKEVKKLNLPEDQYVVFGSGPLSVYGIRASRDIDLLVTTNLYEQLKAEGWTEKEWSDGGYYLSKGIVEADDTWHYSDYNPSPEEIISKAEIIDGVSFAPLSEVLKWKQSYKRSKDLTDIDLIQSYFDSEN